MKDGEELEPTLDYDSETAPVELFDGRYAVLRELGKGGFGRVLLVEDRLQPGERLALKSILAERQNDDKFEVRFQNEIRVLRNLRHERIPQIYNDGKTADGELYYTMAYVMGRELADVMREEKRLEPRRAARIASEVAQVLRHAHDKGVVHRDLKPGNVILTRPGDEDEVVHVLDFGIAKILSREGGLEHAMSMQTQAPIGTPHYMAPEQVSSGTIDGRTDVYALGILLHHMLSGDYPFRGDSWMEIVSARLNEDPEPLDPEVAPKSVRTLVAQMLQRQASKRPSLEEVERRLGAVFAPTESDTKSKAMWPALLGAVGVVGAGLLLWSPWQTEPPPDKDPDPSEGFEAPVTLVGNGDQEEQPVSPPIPVVSLSSPIEGTHLPTNKVRVSGIASHVRGTLLVDDQPTEVTEQGTFECELTLEDGPRELVIREEGVEEVLSRVQVVVDTVEPKLEIVECSGVELAGGEWLVPDSAVALAGIAEDLNLERVTLGGEDLTLSEGGAFQESFDLQGRPVTLRAFDRAGNESSLNRSFVVDAEPPSIVDTSSEGQLAFRVTDAHLDKVTVNGDPVPLDTSGGYARPVELEPGASDEFEVVATDLVQRETRETLVVSRAEAVAPAPPKVEVRLPVGTSMLGEGATEDGLAERIVHERTRIELVLITPPENDAEVSEPYYLARHETTAEAYRLFVLDYPEAEGPVHPAVDLTFEEAQAFCTNMGLRLPTRAEWSWAAKGPDSLEFPWGDGWDPEACNCRGEADDFDGAAPVGSLEADESWCGIRDLCGNVAEWVLVDGKRGAMGGSFRSPEKTCRPVERDLELLQARRDDFGFRVALSIPEED